ncbi:MAG: hypothetical protein Q9209_000848 [Squamulea sp. 1 TL-2023]
MDLPVSGIHRLFTAASSHSGQSYKPPPLESVTEEFHTFNLLYPDFHALQQSQDQTYHFRHDIPSSIASAASSFDDRGALDLHSPRDIRIIVAQDGNIAQQAKVLFDTHPPPPLPAGRLGNREDWKSGVAREYLHMRGLSQRTNTTPHSPTGTNHRRFFSFGQPTHNPTAERRSPLSPAAEPLRTTGDLTPRLNNIRPATSEGETDQIKMAREGKEEVETLLDSMFGSTGTPLLSGTKLHVRPPTPAPPQGRTSQNERNQTSPEPDMPRRRRTPLTRSTTADEIHLMSSSAPAKSANLPKPRSQNTSVLITRLFTADPCELLKPQLTTDAGQLSVIVPEVYQESQQSSKSRDFSEMAIAKQIKCPTYAVAVLLRLPSSSQQGWYTAPQITSPTLPESPRHLSFAMGGQPIKENAVDGSLSSIDHDIEHITVHWSLLTTLLDSFEALLRKELSSLLANVARTFLRPSLPSLQSLAHISNDDLSENTGKPKKKTRQPSQRIIQLPVNALQHSDRIRQAVSQFGHRVAIALRTRRVVTGQGRWSVWREEARWVGRWAGGREQNFFFFNLLTAFLGSHTDWLESITGIRTHRGHSRSQGLRKANAIGRPQTVIVSANKMAARRLIFLLSAFLPSTFPQLQEASMFFPSAWAGTSVSQSPPSAVPVPRRQSLRRTINRRHRGNRASHSSTGFHGRSLSFAGPSSVPGNNAVDSSNGQHVRRGSDARSMKSPAITLAANGDSMSKSSTTTISTVAPDIAVPVAHFSDPALDPLKGANAAQSLQRTLHRSESNEHSNASTSSRSFSRWGSMVSGYWSSRRGSSTDESEFMGRSPEGLGISGATKLPAPTSYPDTLSRMVEEAHNVSQTKQQERNQSRCPPHLSNSAILEDLDVEQTTTEATTLESAEAGSPPGRLEAERCPIKLSVDDDDGVIDVELPPLDSCASSFGSSGGSVGHCNTAASSLNERSSAIVHSPSKERSQSLSDAPTDVAGWLKEYNEDFTLQAVRPYQGLDNDIVEAMKSAARLSTKRALNLDTGAANWTDVMTTLVANTTTFSITRVRLQNRPKPRSQPYADIPPLDLLESMKDDIEERIIEEPIMDMDPILIDAVERIIAQSGHSSRAPSRPASRAPSPSGLAHRAPEITQSRSYSDLHHIPTVRLEVPKSDCKRLVLGALDEVVRSVQAEQDAGPTGARRISGEPVRSGEEGFAPDSTLREGVRKWLHRVETGSGGS